MMRVLQHYTINYYASSYLLSEDIFIIDEVVLVVRLNDILREDAR
jgi:hypothetical protein